MRTIIDWVVLLGVLSSTAGVLLVRAFVAWRTFRLQRRMTRLTRDAVARLQELAGHVTPSR